MHLLHPLSRRSTTGLTNIADLSKYILCISVALRSKNGLKWVRVRQKPFASHHAESTVARRTPSACCSPLYLLHYHAAYSMRIHASLQLVSSVDPTPREPEKQERHCQHINDYRIVELAVNRINSLAPPKDHEEVCQKITNLVPTSNAI